jgi:AcrR family transcriptional regulator
VINFIIREELMTTKASPRKGRRRTQVERRAESEDRLVAAALRLIAKKGLARTTLSEIGQSTGFSRGLPAHHFGNKDGLLDAVMHFVRGQFHARAEHTVALSSGLDELLVFVSNYLSDQSSITMRAWQVIQSEALLLDAPLRQRVLSFNASVTTSLEGRLRTGIEDESIRSDVDPHRGALILIGMLRGVVVQTLMEKNDTEKVRVETVDLVRRAFAAKS